MSLVKMLLNLLLHVTVVLNIRGGAAFISRAPRCLVPISGASSKQNLSGPSKFLLHYSSSDSDIGGHTGTDEGISTTTVASQAALIAGTTIGGGFLALPTATAPCGAAPAALGLIGVWFFLLGGALSLSIAIFMMKRNALQAGGKKSIEKTDISIFSLISECFGSVAGIVGGLLFLLIVKVTFVAQWVCCWRQLFH